MRSLGELIKELRGDASLRDAANKIGISHTYLDTIEKGFDKRSGSPIKPTPETLRLLSDAYNYPYEKLMKVAGYIEEVEVIGGNDKFEYYRRKINEEFPDIDLMFKDMATLTGEDLEEVYEYIRFKMSQKNSKG